MKRLSNREQEIMEHIWKEGPMFVRELLQRYPEPRPHVNTISTIVRILEQKGFLGHTAYGNTYQYHALVTEKEYGESTITGAIRRYFADSYKDVISEFVRKEKISKEELAELLNQLETVEE